MFVKHHSLASLNLGSALSRAYIESDKRLQPFVSHLPVDFDWKNQSQKRVKFPNSRRTTLVEALSKRYQKEGLLGQDKTVSSNLSKLAIPSTLTVTTGHQLNLFTGPAYFIYKISNTIKLAEMLTEGELDNEVVPIFWMASEDHDWQEVNHTFVYNQKIESQTELSGPVGRNDLTDLNSIVDQVISALRWEEDNPKRKIIEQSVENYKNSLSSLTFHIVHELFKGKGLLILDADDALLKAQFAPVMSREIFERKSEVAVKNQSEKLERLGFSSQVHPREINLFHITKNTRSRIEWNGDKFMTTDSKHQWSNDEMKELLKEQAEELSPNVVLRPVYQEYILPNIAYIGGPSELAYWLQLKEVFELYNTPFPNLILRNHALVLDAVSVKRMEKFGLSPVDLFQSEADLIRSFVKDTAEVDLSKEKEELSKTFISIKEKAFAIDPTLGKSMEASNQKMLNDLENIEKRLQKAVKHTEETSINQLKKLHQQVFPDGVLQERRQNYFTLDQLTQGQLLELTLEHFNPLEMDMTIFGIK
jgi:bacillithiol synthase